MRNALRFFYLLVVLPVALVLNSCNDDPTDDPTTPDVKLVKDYSHEVALKWNDLFLEADKNAAGFRPGPAPRALGYLGLAAYEACIPGMPDYNSVATLYSGLEIPAAETGVEYHWPTVVNASYAFLMKRLFEKVPNNQDMLSDMLTLEKFFDNQFYNVVSEQAFSRSKNRGLAVAEAVWNWSKTDQYGHEAYLDPRPATYTPPAGPGLWQPTYPDYGRAMFPYWGRARRFALPDNELLGRPPLPYSESSRSAFYTQGAEVIALSAVDQITSENDWIAQFWSDDRVGMTFSPPARFIAIANQVIIAEDSDLETAVYCYAKMGMSLNDAGVSCWYNKYVYNVERPISYIRRVIDPNYEVPWMPFTPGFPAYPSGHSTFGAAGAEILTDIFGDNYEMVDHCHEYRTEFKGTPRPFQSFYHMAEENAFSRIPLGVHFRMDAEEGLRLGYLCGKRVNQLPWK